MHPSDCFDYIIYTNTSPHILLQIKTVHAFQPCVTKKYSSDMAICKGG